MLAYLEYLSVPEVVGLSIVALLLVMNIVGEILEFKGKVVPEWIKIRKYFSRKKRERRETAETVKEVRRFLGDVNKHYSEDNITKRNAWMQWVNDRATVYDDSIVKINKTLSDVTQALKDNTKMTEEMFVQSSRDRIIDFATKVENRNTMVSREEFNRIFKVYDNYERFLRDHGLTNGEVDINYQIIKESYEEHLHNHTFIEDVRGYRK